MIGWCTLCMTWVEMEPGYYWYRVKSVPSAWSICLVDRNYAHFFGQVSQEIGNEYLTEYVEFGGLVANRIET